MGKKRKHKIVDLRKLSDLETEVMRVVWELEECSSSEVIEAFTKRRKLAPTTIRTVLANIEKKGYLKRVPSLERGHRLRPTIEREAVAEHSLRRLVSNLFNDSPRLAVAYLLKDERLDEEDAEEIRRLLELDDGGSESEKKR